MALIRCPNKKVCLGTGNLLKGHTTNLACFSLMCFSVFRLIQLLPDGFIFSGFKMLQIRCIQVTLSFSLQNSLQKQTHFYWDQRNYACLLLKIHPIVYCVLSTRGDVQTTYCKSWMVRVSFSGPPRRDFKPSLLFAKKHQHQHIPWLSER